MYDATTSGPPRSGPGRIAAAVVLMVGVGGIIAVAFRGSWASFRDAALACHFDRSAADLYPWGVDGLLIITVGALVLLRHDPGARRYCLGIIAAYTGASWLINYLHGLGEFAANPVTHKVPVPPWPVVLVIASLVIGSIFLGSHLLVFVWRHVFPNAIPDGPIAPVHQDAPPVDDDVPAVPELPADAFTVAKDAYRQSLHPDLRTLSQDVMVERFRISKREAARVQSEVKAELAAETAAAATPEPVDVPSQNGQGPA
jgi:hypothetical protein